MWKYIKSLLKKRSYKDKALRERLTANMLPLFADIAKDF